MNPYRRIWTGLVAAALLFAGFAADAQAQQASGTIQGKVVEASSRQPLASVQVSVPGTQRGTLTDREGNFRIAGVPVGARELRVELIGYTSVTRPVTITAEQITTLEVELRQTVINMEEIVVTGVAGETPRAKLPFSVATLKSEALPVPASNAAAMIQGKVAGASMTASSGRPGSAPSILLRGPTSINASGRGQEPLYIVDGVILGGSVIDVDAMDIESIEVVKGAAAASLYGSRAANGVIQITTRRGANVGNDQVRYTVRSEYGNNDLPGRFNLTQKHQFAMNADRTMFIDQQGRECEWLKCATSPRLAGQRAIAGQAASAWNTIQQEAWPGITYDHVDRFFRTGAFMTNYFGIAGRSGGTNYNISLNQASDEGVMPGEQGYDRYNFRLNVDQAVRTDVTVSASTSYSRSRADTREGAMFALTRMPAGVDLMMEDPNFPGEIILKPDPFNDNANPLYSMLKQRADQERSRFMGSGTVKYSPLSWFDIDGSFAFDRLDTNSESFTPKGFRTLSPSPTVNNGNLAQGFTRIDAMNASVTGQVRRTFGDLATRTQVRYLIEKRDSESTSTSSAIFLVDGINTFDNLQPDQTRSSSSITPTRADGFFVISDLDYKDRYGLSGLIRQDGSSLFGAEQRRQWYHRLSAFYRPTEEPWFSVPGLDELKLRYSYGTAGNRPNFQAQYETYNVSGGTVTPQTLGNKDLKPEFATEQEMGIDAVLLSRFSLELTYAMSVVEDQILQVPALAYTGFSSQWRNAGTLESNTLEASLNADLVRRGDLSWNARLLFDRTRQEITELSVPPYKTGASGGQGLTDNFYIRKGETVGTFYGFKFAEKCGHLPAGVDCSQFQVNNDGYLVWVGNAGSYKKGWDTYTDAAGVTRTYWGSTAPFTIRGAALTWGTPFQAEDDDKVTGERTTYLPLGTTTPDFNLSLGNTFSWKGLSLYGLLESVQGISVYNQPLQWAVFQSYAGIMDQSDVPEAERKPVGYYDRLYGASGLQASSAFVTDASYLKLREVSLRYRPSRGILDALPVARGFDGMTFSVTGRNLLTWTDYDGYDPDVGSAGGTLGSASLGRVDGYSYPTFRTLTFGIELNF